MKVAKKPEKNNAAPMSPITLSTHKTTSNRRTGGNMPVLKGWNHVGNYGFCLIYALDDMRRLIDPATGRVILQYRIRG